MKEAEPQIVYVVDDDASICNSLSNLLSSAGFRSEIFNSSSGFLSRLSSDIPSCLILDVTMPNSNGLDFQAELISSDCRIPVIFLTGQADVSMSLRAMKAGAVDFLLKPYHDAELLDAVAVAIDRDRSRREAENETIKVMKRYESLSAREQEVMALVTSGLMNKQAAWKMGLSEITVKVHRGNAMRKMRARTFVDLVKMAGAVLAQAEENANRGNTMGQMQIH
jgi:FixJ family two-component response regulator